MQLSYLLLTAALAQAETPLSLREAVQRAITNNPEVIAERATSQTAKPALLAAQGAFDPILGLRGDWRQATTPATSILQGVNGRLDERTWSQALTTRQRLPWRGMQLETALENSRIATSNPFTSLNPFYQFNQRTTFTIPLWRNSKTDDFRAELKVRRKEIKTLRHDFDSRLLDLVFRVETAYWNLVAATDAHQAALDVERYATESLASTERQVKEGEMAQADLAGARGQLNRASENRANAYGTMLEAQAQLKALLAANPTDSIWPETLRATDSRSTLNAATPAELTREALTNHPDLQAILLRLEAQRDLTAASAEAVKPQVDLSFTHTRQGLAGTGVPQSPIFPGFSLDAPPQLIGGIPRAGNQVLRNHFPTYQATLSIELPLRNRSAEGRLAQQKLIETRITAQRRQAEIALVSGIEQAWARLTAARQRIASAEAAQASSDERLQSEFRLFREGQSNNLNLNTRQNELAESRQLLVNAWRGFNLAAAEIRRISATSLNTFEVKVD
jgi:outer membrane protein TolC